MVNKIIGIILILFSSYVFSFTMHRQYKNETNNIKMFLYILSDIDNILEKYPFDIREILKYLKNKKYAPFDTLFGNCLELVTNENLSFYEAVSKALPESADKNISEFIKETAFSFELPNTEAIQGKLKLVYSNAQIYKDTLVKDGAAKIEMYTRLMKLASVMAVIIFI